MFRVQKFQSPDNCQKLAITKTNLNICGLYSLVLSVSNDAGPFPWLESELQLKLV